MAQGSAFGPLIAGFMVEYANGSWRSYFWLCFAVAMTNFVLMFFLYPESTFHRPEFYEKNNESDSDTFIREGCDAFENAFEDKSGKAEDHVVTDVVHEGYTIYTPSFKDRLTLFRYNREDSLFRLIINPLKLLRHGSVLWAIYTCGCALAPQVILM